MIGWENIAPVLLEVFGNCATNEGKLGDVVSEWHEGSRSFVGSDQDTALLLKVTSCVGLGWDETREEYVPEDSTDPDDADYLGQLRTAQVGQRKLTLQVQAHVLERTDTSWGIYTLERIRSRLRRPANIERLLDVEVALIEIRPTIKATYKDGGRVVSAASMEVVLGAAFTDTDPDPTGWIQYVVYSSHVEDVDGQELPVPPNVVDREVPTIP